MIANYEKTLLEKVDDLVMDAELTNRKLISVTLDETEAQELVNYIKKNEECFYKDFLGEEYRGYLYDGVKFPVTYNGIKLKLQGQIA
jgi:hypothetical protein